MRAACMRAACFWSICKEGLKIFLVTWIESMTTMILKISCERIAWLILHLMAKNLASEVVALTI